MTESYKGYRIAELLEQIADLELVLTQNADEFENETQALRAVQAWTSLVIMKAKLTALQGEQ